MQIKAQDLKVGMMANDSMVVEVGTVEGETIEITFAVFDDDCGEIDYFPMCLDINELFEVEA